VPGVNVTGLQWPRLDKGVRIAVKDMSLSEQAYYDRVDMTVYRNEIAPILPERILDIHTHVWTSLGDKCKYNKYPPVKGYKGAPLDYDFADLDRSARKLFPDREYHAVCFGAAFPEAVDLGINEEVGTGALEWPHRYPLLVAGPSESVDQLRQTLLHGRFYGIKVAVNLEAHAYATDRIAYVFSEAQRKLANALGLMVMLHIPRPKRLADPDNIADIQWISQECPDAKIILAHLGRSYCSWVIKDSIHALKNLDNVYWDVSYVQNPMVYEILFENVDSQRVLFGTDQPMADWRGRRVCVNSQWVDVTRDRYSWAAFRREGLEIEATFIAYEIIQALREGAERAGLTGEKLAAIFFDNGMRLVEDVRRRLSGIWSD